MVIESWADVLTRSFQDVWLELASFLPNIIIAIAVFVIGWLIGSGLGRVVAQIIDSLRVDSALRGAGIEEVLNRAGFTLNAGAFLGGLVKWFIVIVFLLGSLETLRLYEVTNFLKEDVLSYIPQVIAAVLILLVGAVVAQFMQSIVMGAARAAGLDSSNLLGAVTRWSIWIFAIMAALSQLSIVAVFVQTLFTGLVVAVSLALGLSFGLGGQEAAARFIEKLRKEMSENSHR
jgi:Conserved TM helix